MAEAKRVTLSDKDRAKVKFRRLKLELTQTDAGLLAWPDSSDNYCKKQWWRLENDAELNFNRETISPALAVVGLELGDVALKAVKA